ncbi:TPA: spore coat protein [candidate division CPR2 bacterium]|uniref:Spore coat polysaccharide synthesis n=1 Tax=candidate division CPR2 bacterium GW2011_GWC1_41_48 TaxID=1618344 RepID=A0A0G0W6S6_UNCC2|nr:MAG: Spore coat polysaccharide synthesis [candidate division CPR2 bacterium GW2011_GWC2_39_35]KKR28758.1 MAG: Spore coat polysaccharide synthesis [candidate division CPR2 bacterium GW2011_GWD2_39_7]KKS08655.1 MAG: Spore coat polysaccharide synthesis [candidate division CPR2 bacterium GW2011_GWC1_41_48]OGB73147.1 MAG: spore coat protein [candidate division CPR2 bacterium GWD2_39_7]HBG81395.1 spore coat protein [candidate division CPR2 bacterium]
MSQIAQGKIEGVRYKKLVRHADERGFFSEIARDDENLVSKFGQLSMSKTLPGVIKAFHYHKKQDDIWFFPRGTARVVLHDLREDSKTKGATETYIMGEDNPGTLLIPKGVAHGYQVLGSEPVIITYLTTESYDPANPDEERLEWDDPGIGFDWSIKNR